MPERMENPHKFLSPEWYEWTHNCVLPIHEHFMNWARNLDINSVLEIGCGKYDDYHKFFRIKRYMGMDRNLDVIHHCLDKHTQFLGHQWSCDDVCDCGWISSFDLVFSHAVIDHSFDPDIFIRKSIEASRKHTYIMSYRGFFPDIEKHKIKKSTDGYFYNDISVKQVRRLLDSLGHKYELKEVPTGLPPLEIQSELHIIVTK